jgi:hypothetical protein
LYGTGSRFFYQQVKKLKKNLYFLRLLWNKIFGILKVTDEKSMIRSRIRIRSRILLQLLPVTMTPAIKFIAGDNDTGDKFIACDKNKDAMEVGT